MDEAEAIMKNKELKQLFNDVFSFLKVDYGFDVISSKVDRWGYRFLGKNLTTGIKVIYEVREACIYVFLYKLIDGEIYHNFYHALKNDEKEQMLGFALDWIIELKDPEAQIKPTYEYDDGPDSPFYDKENGFRNYAESVAEKLRKYGDEVMRGDFSVFEPLDAIVKDYYRDYYKNN